MATPSWIRTVINRTFSGRFFFSKLTRYPLIGRIADHALFEGDDIFYLPRDRAVKIGRKLESPESVMVPSLVAEHFIREANSRWLMDFCICRESAGCRDYPSDLGCLFLGEAAKGINPKFGRIVTKEEALDHAMRCREAGLVHLIGRNKLDTVWLGVSPGNRLLTLCNCCPCCCLWKILPTVSPEIGNKVSRMPGISVRVGSGCAGCGSCADGICFVDAISLVDGHAVIDGNACRGCGRCVDACPNHAIEIVIENSGFINEAIKRISDAVRVS